MRRIRVGVRGIGGECGDQRGNAGIWIEMREMWKCKESVWKSKERRVEKSQNNKTGEHL